MDSQLAGASNIVQSRILLWALLLSMLASNMAVHGDAIGAKWSPALDAVQHFERESRMAIRYSIWMYRVYRINVERHVNPGTKAS
jgi:hypothetical protein